MLNTNMVPFYGLSSEQVHGPFHQSMLPSLRATFKPRVSEALDNLLILSF